MYFQALPLFPSKKLRSFLLSSLPTHFRGHLRLMSSGKGPTCLSKYKKAQDSLQSRGSGRSPNLHTAQPQLPSPLGLGLSPHHSSQRDPQDGSDFPGGLFLGEPLGRHFSPQTRSKGANQGAKTAPRIFLLASLFSSRHPWPLPHYLAIHGWPPAPNTCSLHISQWSGIYTEPCQHWY